MRYVLVVQGEKVSALAVGRSEYSVPVVFLNDQRGLQQFSVYLRERHDSLFSVVIDSKDEEHHQAKLPALNRRDQRRMLNRLQRQYFPSNALCAVTVPRRKSTAGGKAGATISGIGDQNDCDHWLGLLKAESTLIAEIYSLSLLGALLPVVSSTGISLCAVQLGSNDFRLMAYEGARLLISRHITLTGDLSLELATQLSQTLTYIESMAIPAQDNNSQVAVPGNPSGIGRQANVSVIGDLPPEVCSALASDNIKFYRWDKLVQLAGNELSGTLTGAVALFAALSVKKQSRDALLISGHYGCSYLSRRLRHLLIAGSLSCLGVTMAAAATTVHYSQTYESLAEFAQYLQVDFIAPLPTSFSIAGAEYPVEAVRDSLRLSRQLEASAQSTPLHFLRAVAADLTVYPELQVTSIKWGRADTTMPAGLEISGFSEINGQLSGESYTATIEGYVRGGETNTISSSGRFNSFIAALKAANRYTSVTVLENPFAISRNSFDAERHSPGERLRFSIELINQDTVQ